MPEKITVEESHQPRKIGPDWREYAYIVTGTADETAAQNATAAERPLYVAIPNPHRKKPDDPPTIKLRQSVTAQQEIAGSETKRHTWTATMRYEPVEADEEEEILNYSISITTNTANVKVALEQTKKLATGASDPKFGNHIGVIRNGTGWDIQGVDCIFPQATLEIERRYPLFTWNQKVKQIIHKVGMVNSGSFEGFGEEEVLFGGARVLRGRNHVSVNYQFLISRSEDIEIDGIGKIHKKGWRYIWAYSVNRPKEIGTQTVAAYAARVYKRTSFSGIL